MTAFKAFFVPFFIIAMAISVRAQTNNCQAYFNYTYSPWLTQPEEDIYLFTDSSTGIDSTTSFLWSFGTGDFSSSRNASFTYDIDDSPSVQVCLTVHNADNGCTNTYCDSLMLHQLCVGARYTYTQQGDTFNFNGTICGQWDSVKWDFGDTVIVSASDTMMHIYPAAADSYYVCMETHITSLCQYYQPCNGIYCEPLRIYPTGINSVNSPATYLHLYPDPANSYIVADIGQTGFTATTISISDITGHVLLIKTVDNSIQRFSIENLAPGIYYIKVKDELEQARVAKFVKQ